MRDTNKGPRAAVNGSTGSRTLQPNHTLTRGERQSLSWILEFAFRAIDHRRFAFATQLVALALHELGRFENASGEAVGRG